MTNYYGKLHSWKPDSPHVVEFERKIIKFIVATNQSLSVVDNEKFRDLLPKQFNAPSRKTLTQKCLVSCFEHTKKKLLFDINKTSTKYIGIQIDHTTASNYMPFGNMSMQYVKDDFTLGAIILATLSMKANIQLNNSLNP